MLLGVCLNSAPKRGLYQHREEQKAQESETMDVAKAAHPEHYHFITGSPSPKLLKLEPFAADIL